MENNRWDEFRVEFSISAVKTKSLWTKVAPKAWTHHCLTYEHSIGTVTMFSQGKRDRTWLRVNCSRRRKKRLCPNVRKFNRT